MTVLWQNFKRRQEVQPTAPAPEVQAKLSGLEKEVATLKALLQSQDEELVSRDSIIYEERSINTGLKKEVFDTNERYNRYVKGLSKELDRLDQLESRLWAVPNECSKACKNVEVAEAEKEKLKAKVERLEAEKSKAVKAQDKSESLLIKLRARYDECKAKTKRYLK
jgi:chromosome segregation ATPase